MNTYSWGGDLALNKLLFPLFVRYSEDLDFVLIKPGSIKKIVSTFRELIDPWLGPSRLEPVKNGFRIYYQFVPESDPEGKKRINIEINTNEIFTLYPLIRLEFEVPSKWYSSQCYLKVYDLNELMGIKLRALYQELRGRDLFDLDWVICTQEVDLDKIVIAFKVHLNHQKNLISAMEFLLRLKQKLNDDRFHHYQDKYLWNHPNFSPRAAFENIKNIIILI